MSKKFILSLFILFTIKISFGQIGAVEEIAEKVQVGYNNNFTKFHSLSYQKGDNGIKVYSLVYRNMEYDNVDTYETLVFTATDEELEYLYNFFKEGMKDKSGKTLELGEHKILVKKMGKGVQISDVSDYKTPNLFWLLPKELDRLFGKRK